MGVTFAVWLILSLTTVGVLDPEAGTRDMNPPFEFLEKR